MDPAPSNGKPKEIRYPDGRIEHPTVDREPRDVRFRRAIGVIVGALVIGAIELWAVWGFYKNRERHEERINASRYPLRERQTGELPREPRLEQVDRLAGIRGESVRRREISDDELLSTYGSTTDEDFIRIPIDKAMELGLGELHSRDKKHAPDEGKSSGLVNAGESNSGRLFRKRSP
jgi:hypothetical protein